VVALKPRQRQPQFVAAAESRTKACPRPIDCNFSKSLGKNGKEAQLIGQ
jgi:hypothetical protein